MYKNTEMILAIILSLALSCDKVPQHSGNGGGGPSSSQTLEIPAFQDLNQGSQSLNSHARQWHKSSLKMDYRSYLELGPEDDVVNPTYTRISTLSDGSYILTWQDAVGVNGNGENTFYALSKDLKKWDYMGYLWQGKSVTNGLGDPDTRRYTNANTLQLSNGEILAVASFSTIKTYNQEAYRNEQGIVIKKSNDGGLTWYGEKEIYHGPNWEAHLMEIPGTNGEIQCFFSESRPWTSGSHSGTTQVISKDWGNTWTPVDTGYRVMRKHWWNAVLGMYCYTYQMPVGIILNDSKKFAFAMESCNQRVRNSNGSTSDQFSVAIVFSNDDGSWTHLEGDEITPKEQRIDSVIARGASPYLVQFPSGETLLAYVGTDALQHFRIGNATATGFGTTDIAALPYKGSWGGLNQTSSHTVISCMRNVRDGSDNAVISLAKFHLNHDISATSRTVSVDADDSDWADTDEALFVGSNSQAQATLRCSSDEDNLYFIIDVLDEALSNTDFAYLLLSPVSENTRLSAHSRRIRVGCNGLNSTDQYAGGWREYGFGVKAAVAYDGTVGNNDDTDNGFRVELSVPRKSIDIVDGKVLVNFGYFDAMANVDDALYDASNTEKWLSITVN